MIGDHTHCLQGIEFYKHTPIIYSLGNFCFAGHKSPRDMTSIMFQIRYKIKNGTVSYKDFRVIPIRISSKQKINDFIPTPFKPGAESDSIFSTMRSNYNTKGLDYAVTEFPMEFE